MGMAARSGDMTLHTVTLTGPGCPTVSIGGNAAWRVGDQHACSMQNTTPPPASAPVPHATGSVLKGSFTVLVGSQMATRQNDVVVEPACIPPTVPFPPNNLIQMGCPTVDIGDIAFGLMDPAVLRQFCAEWRQLRQDWPNLTPAQRQQRMEQMVNNALGSSGTPGVNGINANAPPTANAVYNPWTNSGGAANTISVPSNTFASAASGATPSPPGALGATLIHEAQHAAQWYANAQYLAGQGMNAGQIAAATGVDPGVAANAVANPAAADTAAGQLGAMNNAQQYGGGAGYNNQIRNLQQTAYNTPQYPAAYAAYYGLPNERNAEDVGDALRAICPDAN
jgi:uncharacterized Zn-binding protein involved in type VI secretion